FDPRPALNTVKIDRNRNSLDEWALFVLSGAAYPLAQVIRYVVPEAAEAKGRADFRRIRILCYKPRSSARLVRNLPRARRSLRPRTTKTSAPSSAATPAHRSAVPSDLLLIDRPESAG